MYKGDPSHIETLITIFETFWEQLNEEVSACRRFTCRTKPLKVLISYSLRLTSKGSWKTKKTCQVCVNGSAGYCRSVNLCLAGELEVDSLRSSPRRQKKRKTGGRSKRKRPVRTTRVVHKLE